MAAWPKSTNLKAALKATLKAMLKKKKMKCLKLPNLKAVA